MFRITKDFYFSTRREEGEEAHYVVRAELSAAVLNAVGFVRDYGELAPLAALVKTYHGRAHEEAFPAEIPTTTDLAAVFTDYFRDTFPEQLQIVVMQVAAGRAANEFHFSASHVLSGLREGHPCGRMHGHNYMVRVETQYEDEDLSVAGAYIDTVLDHRHLNDVLPGMQSSAENLAHSLFDRFVLQIPGVIGVSVSETPKTWAEYRL